MIDRMAIVRMAEIAVDAVDGPAAVVGAIEGVAGAGAGVVVVDATVDAADRAAEGTKTLLPRIGANYHG